MTGPRRSAGAGSRSYSQRRSIASRLRASGSWMPPAPATAISAARWSRCSRRTSARARSTGSRQRWHRSPPSSAEHGRAARGPDDRTLPGARAGWRWWHGRHLQGARHAPRPHGRAQVPPRRASTPTPRPRKRFRPEARAAGGARASEHLHDLRHRRDGGRAALSRDAAATMGRPSSSASRAARWRSTTRRTSRVQIAARAGEGARARDHPPRHQAGERVHHHATAS